METSSITVSSCTGNITGSVKDTFGVGISGVNLRLYEDLNEDGVADNATTIRSVFTNSGGGFSMASLPVRSYVIQCINPSNFTVVSGIDTTNDNDDVVNSPTTDLYIPASIVQGEVDADNVFIFDTNPGSITGYVFVDSDNDEVPDVGEGLAGVTVEIYEDIDQDGVSDGVLIDTTTTDADGFYQFTNVATNTYSGRKRHGVIVVTTPVGYNLVKDIDTSNDGDVVTNTITTNGIIPFTLLSGEVDSNNLFILELTP